MNRVDSNAQLGTGARDFKSEKQNLPKQSGNLQGQTVQVKDAASALLDRAEELSMDHSERVESKTMGERDVKADGSARVMQAEEINAYLDATQSFSDLEKLAALAKRMQSSQENSRELARQQSRDPTTQYVLLQNALVDARKNSAEDSVINRLEDALEDLEFNAGPQIRAGLNTVDIASERSESSSEFQVFQDTYRDIALGDATLSGTLKLVLERLAKNGTEMRKGLDDLIRSLGADISATRPSTDKTRLQTLVQDLYQLSVSATVLDSCGELSDSLESKFGCTKFMPVDLMKELITITSERWVSASRFNSLGENFGISENTQALIYFLTSNKTMLCKLPPIIFQSDEFRQGVIDAVQKSLDEAIDKEDDEEI
jgi:type III secretion protein W